MAATLLAGCETTYASRPTPQTPPPGSYAQGCDRPGHGERPARGRAVPFDAVPEASLKVAPRYPDAAREAGVDGTVIVAALVCEHGRVVDEAIVESIPMLDAAALEAVSGWTFVPARYQGRPVARWVDVPVRFTLH